MNASTYIDIIYHLTTLSELLWKLDLIILPLLALIYFTHSLDRANLGNAKTDGIEDDLHFGASKYSLMLTLFYIPYGTLNIPSTVLAKRFSPAVVIPCLMFGWGAISLSAAAAKNWGGLVTTRILLGVVEAGFVRLNGFFQRFRDNGLTSIVPVSFGHLLPHHVLYSP